MKHMNKYKTLIIVMFFLCIFCFSRVNAVVKDYTLLGKTIYLDAGHGGKDSGAISSTIIEKDMNLILTNLLAKELTSKGAYVLLTRDGDYDLSESTKNRKRNDLYNRAKLINESNCDLYISIHLNSSTQPSWNGLQIFYTSVNKKNKLIASIITETLKENMSNIKDIKEENNYYMYPKIKVKGVLIEAGFISNPNDNYKLRQEDYQNKLIKNIVKGIENYFNNSKVIV